MKWTSNFRSGHRNPPQGAASSGRLDARKIDVHFNMNNQKILYLITQDGPWGGAQKYVFDLATGLTDRFDVTVAVGESGRLHDLQKKLMATNLPLTIIQLKHLVRNISPLHDTLAVAECAKLFQKLQPDIIHANSSKAGIITSLAKTFAHSSTPLVYTVHGWVTNEPMSPLKKWLYRSLEQHTIRQKNAFIVLSPQEYKTARAVIAVPESKLKLIPLGIGQSEILPSEEARKKLLERCGVSNNTTNTFWIGSIANFYPTKGIDILIDAVADANKRIPNLHVFLIGDGPERSSIEQQITEYHLESVIHLTGFLDNAAAYLPAFDLFALASRKEGTPYTILEAIKNGTPVVATAVGGVLSIIKNNENGLLVSPENSTALTEAILFSHRHPEAMKRMADRAHGRVPRKNIMIEQTISLYESLATPLQ